MSNRNHVPKLSLKTHTQDGRPEVGVTNLYGNLRVIDFLSVEGTTAEDCDEYIDRLERASHRIIKGILLRRSKRNKRINTGG